MKVNSEFKFKVSLSKDAYSNKEISGAMIGSSKVAENKEIRKKYGFKANVGVGYQETELTPNELLESLITGHVFCHLFNPETIRKDGCFSSSQKKDMNFKGSYVIGVDIDHTGYQCAEEFIDRLSLKPTLWYTSYSNLQADKGARFRLIYVFDEIIASHYLDFRFAAYHLNKIIERDTNEIIDDDCNLRCSQYFNGTNKNNTELYVSYGITNNIYSTDDLGIGIDEYIEFLEHNGYYKTNTHKEDILNILNSIKNQLTSTTYYNELENKDSEENTAHDPISEEAPLYDAHLLDDMAKLSYDEFMKYNRHRFKYFYRVEKKDWINDSYQRVDDNYFRFPYSYGNGKISRDGSHRRKRVFMRMCLRRAMNPDVDADTILFNAYEDIHRFFDWTGLDLKEFLKKNIEFCFGRSVQDIEDEYSEILRELRETTRPKKGIIYKNREAHSKSTTYNILDEYYDPELSVAENLDLLNNEYEYVIGKSTIYLYLKDRNLKTDYLKLSDTELLGIIDINLSIRKNLEILKDNNIKISKDRLSRLLSDKRVITTTTYYNEMENKDN